MLLDITILFSKKTILIFCLNNQDRQLLCEKRAAFSRFDNHSPTMNKVTTGMARRITNRAIIAIDVFMGLSFPVVLSLPTVYMFTERK